jgi:hypothetical protein
VGIVRIVNKTFPIRMLNKTPLIPRLRYLIKYILKERTVRILIIDKDIYNLGFSLKRIRFKAIKFNISKDADIIRI